MSGLVSGLQNRVRRFESARNLNNPSQIISERDFLLGTLGTSIVWVNVKTGQRKNLRDS